MKYEEKPHNDSRRLEEVWKVKERIKKEEGLLRQSRGFFSRSYKRNKGHLCIDIGEIIKDGDSENKVEKKKGKVVGFETIRSDGYILFLGVSPDYRGLGIGKRLIKKAKQDHGSLSCHARKSNEKAIGFYKHLGFEIKKKIDSYYENGESAYYLVKGERDIKDKLKSLV